VSIRGWTEYVDLDSGNTFYYKKDELVTLKVEGSVGCENTRTVVTLNSLDTPEEAAVAVSAQNLTNFLTSKRLSDSGMLESDTAALVKDSNDHESPGLELVDQLQIKGDGNGENAKGDEEPKQPSILAKFTAKKAKMATLSSMKKMVEVSLSGGVDRVSSLP
jgi:hypothetical protein